MMFDLGIMRIRRMALLLSAMLIMSSLGICLRPTVSEAFLSLLILEPRFAGGCTTTNANNSCTIRVKVTTNFLLQGIEVTLEKSDSGPRGPFRRFSRIRVPQPTAEDANIGYAEFRFRNDPLSGVCYRARTTSGVKSSRICIK